MSVLPRSIPPKKLAQSILSTDSSFKLNNILDWDGATDLTSSDFGTRAFGVFKNDQNTRIEIFEFDPSTIASASITLLARGLQFDGDLDTEVAANKRNWVANETTVMIGTDVPQLLNQMVDLSRAQTVAGRKTFTTNPRTSAGNPTDDNDLARKAYVDSVVGGVAITNQLVVAGTAGETIAAGDLVYFDSVTANEWMLCDADTAATVENVLLGIAQGAGTDGNAITSGVLLRGYDDNQTGLTGGNILYAGNTAGEIAESAGTKEVTVGVSISATEIYFSTRFNQELTENQQDLIEQFEAGTDWYAASSVGTDSYAITITPAITAYAAGMKFRFKADVVNTGAATLAVSGLAAKTIKKNNDQDLENGDIEAGAIVEVVYDGTNMQMVSQTSRTLTVDEQTFTSSGTWTKPVGAKRIHIQAWGGGGGGAGGTYSGGTPLNEAGGGGGGLYIDMWMDADTAGATETVTIGAGGAGGSSAAGSNGGDTTFGSWLTADGGGGGGQGGAGAAGGNGGYRHAVITGLNGAGQSEDVGLPGIYSAGGGGSASGGIGKDGGDSDFGGAGGGGAGPTQGAGGTSVHGGNGGAGVDEGTAGNAGTQPGGGGGAAADQGYTGGAGGAGQVIVTTFF